jgi:hypothetical protein
LKHLFSLPLACLLNFTNSPHVNNRNQVEFIENKNEIPLPSAGLTGQAHIALLIFIVLDGVLYLWDGRKERKKNIK